MSNFDSHIVDISAEEVVLPLSCAEIKQLRRLLSIAHYDENQAAFVINTGRAQVLVRDDGTIRCEGAEVVVTAGRHIIMDAAAIELN